MKVQVKVCGITDPSFAAEAEKLGVNYLGFIFHPSSPRHLTPEKAATITAALTGAARRVGVFVKQTPAEIVAIMREAKLDIVQLHRRATAADINALHAAGYPVWSLAGGEIADAVLFDSSHGDGESVFRAGPYKTILAGRLGVENLSEALALHPDILDVNSSLETSPGVKDITRLQLFLRHFYDIICGN